MSSPQYMPGWLPSVSNLTREKGSEPLLAELTVPEVCRLLEVALPLSPRATKLRLAWSHWRRAKRQQARRRRHRRRAVMPTSALYARNRLGYMIAAFAQFGDESHPSAAVSTSRWTIPLVCQGFPLSTVKPSLQTRGAIYGNMPRFWHGHDLRRNGVPAWEAESSGPGDVTRDSASAFLSCVVPKST